MYPVEKVVAPNEDRRAVIYMRDDGLFEGRIFQESQNAGSDGDHPVEGESYEVCAVTETLPRARTIVYEELGL